jgi:hypothetical protein
MLIVRRKCVFHLFIQKRVYKWDRKSWWTCIPSQLRQHVDLYSINMISFTFSAVITRLLNSLFPGIIERTGAWKISAHLSLAKHFQTIELDRMVLMLN